MAEPNPLTILKEAVKQVPALKYAVGVLGIVSVLVIAKMFQLTPGAAWFGVIGVVILMVLLFVFAKAVATPSSVMRVPAVFLIWSFLTLAVASAFLIFVSLFFNWPRPLDEIVKEIGGSESSTGQVENIPAKDFAKIIQPPQQGLLLHWCGLPSAQLLLTLHNPYNKTLKLTRMALIFTAPDGSSFTLRPEAIIMPNGVWNPPIETLEIKNDQDVTWAYSFFNGLPTDFQLLSQRVNAELAKKPAILQLPDPNAQNVSPELTKAFADYLNQQFKWTAGKWKMDITATYGEGSEIDVSRFFNLTQSDVNAMKAISKYYASGYGLLNQIRFLPILDASPGKQVELSSD